jgi:hypothetical protein
MVRLTGTFSILIDCYIHVCSIVLLGLFSCSISAEMSLLYLDLMSSACSRLESYKLDMKPLPQKNGTEIEVYTISNSQTLVQKTMTTSLW